MNKGVVEFINKVAEDKELQARLQAAADVDEVYAIASDVQGGFTKEEFVEDVTKIRDAISDNEELSDDDLKALAGGKDTAEIAVGIGAIATMSGVYAGLILYTLL